MTGNSGKRKLAFIGILIVNFMTMFLICGVGVYGYSVAGYFDSIASVGMIFTPGERGPLRGDPHQRKTQR